MPLITSNDDRTQQTQQIPQIRKGRPGARKDGKPLYAFKLMAGWHQGYDYSQEPKEIKNEDTGEITHKYPHKDFRQGEVVLDVNDLVAQHGPKFMRLQSRVMQSDPNGERQGSIHQAAGMRQQVASPGGQVMQEATDSSFSKSSTEVQQASREIHDKQPDEFDEEDLQSSQKVTSTLHEEGDDDEYEPAGEPESRQSLDELYGPLDKLNVNDLKSVAQEEKIDLKGLTTKREILEALRKAPR